MRSGVVRDDCRYVALITINFCMALTSHLIRGYSVASQSSNSGWEGWSPCEPKLSVVFLLAPSFLHGVQCPAQRNLSPSPEPGLILLLGPKPSRSHSLSSIDKRNRLVLEEVRIDLGGL